MNRNQLALLVVILVVLGGAGLLLVKHNQETWSEPGGKLGQKLLPSFQMNDVAAIHIQGDDAVDLQRKDDGWKVQERGGYPANFGQISELLIKISDLKVGQSEGIGASQLARMRLEEPGKGSNSATLLEFKDSQGKTLDALLIGKKHLRKSEGGMPGPMGDEGYPDGRYVMLKSDPKTVLTISDPLNSVEPKATEWLNKDFFKVEKPQTISFVSTNATNSWKLSRETETSPWVLADLKPGEILDSNKVTSLSSSLGYPSFVDVVADAASAKTGLDHPLAVTIETFDHFTYAMKVGSKTPENDYYFNVTVTGAPATERTPGKDEKPDDKKKLDQAFQDKLKQTQEKLKQEQSLAPWTYLVNNWIVDPVIRDRAQLMVEKKAPAPAGAETNAAPEEMPLPEK
ncbi:MAG TPA: DUF4340 domain-containing protein [Verrucomicrobiae bacterium]|jgi:hypothetical protein|nr:DUF4340 domain-containing protein [Verrucomicrobiae bacterium]